jgi:hypothetical protein
MNLQYPDDVSLSTIRQSDIHCCGILSIPNSSDMKRGALLYNGESLGFITFITSATGEYRRFRVHLEIVFVVVPYIVHPQCGDQDRDDERGPDNAKCDPRDNINRSILHDLHLKVGLSS